MGYLQSDADIMRISDQTVRSIKSLFFCSPKFSFSLYSSTVKSVGFLNNVSKT